MDLGWQNSGAHGINQQNLRISNYPQGSGDVSRKIPSFSFNTLIFYKVFA